MDSGIGFATKVDPALVERAKRKDTAAFAKLYQVYAKPCYNLVLRMTAQPATAEDIVQEVFLKLMKRIGSFRGEAPFGAWLRRVTVNTTINHMAKLKPMKLMGTDEEMYLQHQARDEDYALTGRPDLWSLLEGLPFRSRSVLVLHDIEGYTHREIADMFKQTESFSKSLLARTRAHLRKQVAVPGEEDGK